MDFSNNDPFPPPSDGYCDVCSKHFADLPLHLSTNGHKKAALMQQKAELKAQTKKKRSNKKSQSQKSLSPEATSKLDTEVKSTTHTAQHAGQKRLHEESDVELMETDPKAYQDIQIRKQFDSLQSFASDD